MQKTKRQWNRKEFEQILKNNHYRLERYTAGSHRIYTNGDNKMSIPFVKLNPMLIRRLIKENNLRVEQIRGCVNENKL